jgi:hypothetical protein
MNLEDAPWLVGMLKKRTPDAIRILCDLIEAGLKKGECSANDIRDVSFDQPNIIGGVFKILGKFGFEHTDRRIKTIALKKHGRRVDVWKVNDYNLLMETHNVLAGLLLNNIKKQMNLF